MLVVEISHLFKRHLYSTILRSCWPNLKLKIFTPFYHTRPKSPVYASNRLSLPLSTILKSLIIRCKQPIKIEKPLQCLLTFSTNIVIFKYSSDNHFLSVYFLNALQSYNSNRVYVLRHKYILGPSQSSF